MSRCAQSDADSLKQLLFQPVLGRFDDEIRTQSARFKDAFEKPIPAFTGIFEDENVASADDFTLHAANLANTFDATNTVAHPLDLHHEIDRTGDLRPQCS